MDLHQPVMKSHRNLIGLVCAKFNPSLGIVQQLAQGHRNLPKRNPNIAFVLPVFTCPSPNIAQHTPVQFLHELFSEKRKGRGCAPP